MLIYKITNKIDGKSYNNRNYYKKLKADYEKLTNKINQEVL